MWIEREISSILTQAVSQRPALLLTGARQTGKSSLLRYLFSNHQYYSLDAPLEAENAEVNADQIIKQALEKHPGVIFDEIQNAPKLFKFVKSWIDKSREKTGRFIFTGSQKFPLMQGVSESLAGRIAVHELQSLSGSELRSVKLTVSLFRGFYPEVCANSTLDPNDFYRDYLVTYLERDVRTLLRVKELRNFDRFLRACAGRVGQLINFTEIAKDVGVSPPTISEWISLLEASDIIFLLEPFHENRNKRWIKAPKLYFNDTGLLSFLLRIKNDSDLFSGPFIGPFWENFTISEFRKKLLNLGKRPDLFFMRDKYGKEADILIDQGKNKILIECKASQNPSRSSYQDLFLFQDYFLKENCSVDLFVASRVDHPLKTHDQVTLFNPLNELSSELKSFF